MSSMIISLLLFVYFLSAVMHAWTLLTRPGFFQDPGKLPQQTAALGWGLHTVILLFLWATSASSALMLSESHGLIFLAIWLLVTVYLGLQFFSDVRWAGALSMSLVVVLLIPLAMSSHFGLGVDPAGVEYESVSFGAHFFLTVLGYVFLIMGSVFGIFYLLKEKIQIESLMLGHAAITVMFLLFGMLKWHSFFTGTSRLRFEWIQFGSIIFWCLYFTAVFLNLYVFRSLKILIQWIFSTSMCFLLVYLVSVFPWVNKHGAGLHVFTILFALTWSGGLLLRLFWIEEGIDKRLPDSVKMDSLCFYTLVAGFFFATLGFVSGGVWSYLFSGQYLAWNSKQIWMFVVWTFYGAVLHLRQFSSLKSWNFSVLSIVGFFIVMFTLLRVNWVIL